MPEPLFETVTPRLGLPLLFAGQAQKEGYVNEIAARIDSLLFLAIEGQADTPPTDPDDGTSWLIGSNPVGAWAGKAGHIASFQAGNWLFSAPFDGMRLLDRSSGQEIRHIGQWTIPQRPAVPTGGATVDTEARAAIAAIVASLTDAGIVPAA